MFYLQQIEEKFSRTWTQIASMDAEIRGLLTRYDSARVRGQKSTCYNLRMRISITEGVRYMFLQYYKELASDIALLRRRLYNQIVVVFDEATGDLDDFDILSNLMDEYEDDSEEDQHSFTTDDMEVEESSAWTYKTKNGPFKDHQLSRKDVPIGIVKLS